MSRKISPYFVLFILTLFSFAAASPAESSTKSPLEVVKTGVNQAKSIIDNTSVKYDTKRKMLHEVLLPFFDTEEMAKRALGVNKKVLGQDKDKAKKRLEEFTRLFVELIENQYLRLSTIDSAKDANVSYVEEKIDGNYATVDTAITTKNGTRTPVSYRLILGDEGWKVFDIVIEGVSLISNYRSQFNAILNKGSSGSNDPFDFLMDKIKEKLAEAKSR